MRMVAPNPLVLLLQACYLRAKPYPVWYQGLYVPKALSTELAGASLTCHPCGSPYPFPSLLYFIQSINEFGIEPLPLQYPFGTISKTAKLPGHEERGNASIMIMRAAVEKRPTLL